MGANSEVDGDQTVVSCVQEHEASFQYTDAGAACSDVIDGATDHTCTLSFVPGTENKEDTTCRGGYYNYIRSVQVVDTLKPVITLKYGSDIVAQGPVDDTTPKGTTEGSINAAGTN